MREPGAVVDAIHRAEQSLAPSSRTDTTYLVDEAIRRRADDVAVLRHPVQAAHFAAAAQRLEGARGEATVRREDLNRRVLHRSEVLATVRKNALLAVLDVELAVDLNVGAVDMHHAQLVQLECEGMRKIVE